MPTPIEVLDALPVAIFEAHLAGDRRLCRAIARLAVDRQWLGVVVATLEGQVVCGLAESDPGPQNKEIVQSVTSATGDESSIEDAVNGEDLTPEQAEAIADILVAIYGDDAMSHFDDGDAELTEARKVGDKWQGPSGRWFTVNTSGRVVPTKSPDSAAKSGPKASAKPKVDHKANAAAAIKDAKAGKSNADELASKLHGMTVVDLNALKKEHGLKASGNKAELVKKLSERLMEKFGNPQSSQKPKETRPPVARKKGSPATVIPKNAPAVPGKKAGGDSSPTKGHPFEKMSRDQQVKQIATWRSGDNPRVNDEDRGEAIGRVFTEKAVKQFESAKNKNEVANAVASEIQRHDQANNGIGIHLDRLYKAVGDSTGATKAQVIGALVTMHNDGAIRLSGWPKMLDEIPDPEMAIPIGTKVMFAANVQR